MYSDALFLLLLLGGVAMLILIVGVVLSILVFSTKSLAMEIIAWICGGLWLVFFQVASMSDALGSDTAIHFLRYPAFIIFFLLLQYRANLAYGNNLKILYIAKSAILLLLVFSINSQLINFLVERGWLDYSHQATRYIIPGVSAIISITVMAVITYAYLQRINASVAENEVFKNAIIFTTCSYFFADVASHILFYIQYASRFRYIQGYSFFSTTMLTTQLIFFIVESLLAAAIAAYIYKSKQESGAINTTTIKD